MTKYNVSMIVNHKTRLPVESVVDGIEGLRVDNNLGFLEELVSYKATPCVNEFIFGYDALQIEFPIEVPDLFVDSEDQEVIFDTHRDAVQEYLDILNSFQLERVVFEFESLKRVD